jgi:glycosyltransferase involved in cell wall biosynthesis
MPRPVAQCRRLPGLLLTTVKAKVFEMTKRAINIFSPNWATEDSYGRLAIELALGFEDKGYHVNRFGDGAPDNQPIRPVYGGLFLGYPTLFGKFYEEKYGVLAKMGTRVAVTMFESTKLLNGWATGLNRCNAVIVPSSFLKPVFRRNGVKASIHVLPLGVSQEFLAPKLRTFSSDKPLTFLAIADRGARKAWDKALFSFVEAFGDDMRFKLILKSRGKQFELTNPNVERVCRDMTNAELAELYHQADVMIFPSSGEGFGLPPREFAATGGIALATNWGGTADALQEWGISLPAKMGTAWRDKREWYGKLGQWAEVDQDMLALKLRLIANYFEIFAQQSYKSAAPFVAREYQWSRFVNGVESIWRDASETKMKPEVQYASAGD